MARFICALILGAFVAWVGHAAGVGSATIYVITLTVGMGFALTTSPRPRDG